MATFRTAAVHGSDIFVLPVSLLRPNHAGNSREDISYTPWSEAAMAYMTTQASDTSQSFPRDGINLRVKPDRRVANLPLGSEGERRRDFAATSPGTPAHEQRSPDAMGTKPGLSATSGRVAGFRDRLSY